MFDAKRFLDDYSIQYITEGHKHSRPGWIQIKCPFCNSREGWHLGLTWRVITGTVGGVNGTVQ